MAYSKRESFTLIEILVVVIIMAILAALAIPVYQNATARAEMRISAANLVAELEKFKIGLMKSSYLYKPSHNMFCKNRKNTLENTKEFLLDVFCIKSAYADGNKKRKYKYVVNQALTGLTWDQIKNDDRFDRVPILVEFPDRSNISSNFNFRDGEYYTDITNHLKFQTRKYWHRYGGRYLAMFIRRNGKVYIMYANADRVGAGPVTSTNDDPGVEEWTGR